jgi:hypothetical protein
MGGAVPGVVGIVSVRVDGLREAISGTVIIGSMDGCPIVIDASSSSKSSLVAINGGCRERHQTKKARQHEYVITGNSQLREGIILVDILTQPRIDPVGQKNVHVNQLANTF